MKRVQNVQPLRSVQIVQNVRRSKFNSEGTFQTLHRSAPFKTFAGERRFKVRLESQFRSDLN
jgi:hypothetical protein